MAILLGTIAGGVAGQGRRRSGRRSSALMIVFALALLGRRACSSRATGEAAPDLAHRREHRGLDLSSCSEHLRDDPRLWWGALVTSWFWLVGAVVLSLLPPLVKNVVGGNEEVVTAYLAFFSIAVAVGSGPRRLARAADASSCCRR